MSRILLPLLLAGVPSLAHCQTVTTEEAAAHVIFSYTGTTPPSTLMTLAEQCAIGGLILFGDNVDSSLPAYLEQLQQTYLNANCPINHPILIVTDQEGGEVRRLPGGPDLSEKEIGEQSNFVSAASTAGSQAAAALGAYNMNGNLAPVLDVFRTPGDFDDQYQRSYSDNATIADECGAAFVKAQQGAGYVATAKHFPGLGAATANQDTDAGPVTLNVPLAELRSIDEAAFVESIAAGIQMVMPSWALYPALDPTYPSGVSQAWLQGELRERLGYTGVIISDAIEAGGLNMFGSNVGFRARLAINAGQDLILAALGNPEQGESVTAAIISNVQNGSIPLSRLQASTARIAALRATLG